MLFYDAILYDEFIKKKEFYTMNVRTLLIFVGNYIFTLNLDEQLALAEV